MRKKKPDGTFLELDGEVSILTRKKGKVTREKLDGQTVLKSVLYIIERAVDEFTRNPITPVETKRLKKKTTLRDRIVPGLR